MKRNPRRQDLLSPPRPSMLSSRSSPSRWLRYKRFPACVAAPGARVSVDGEDDFHTGFTAVCGGQRVGVIAEREQVRLRCDEAGRDHGVES